MRLDSQAIVRDFGRVAALAGIELSATCLSIQELPAPHRPTGLPLRHMAVYVFSYNGRTLKVGKAGPNSDARFRSQHYNPSSSASNLAASILKNPGPVANAIVDVDSVGDWIRDNTDRVNFILDESVGIDVLTMLESFVQCRLQPAYEGFASQRSVGG